MNLIKQIFAGVIMALTPGCVEAYTHLSPYAYCAGNPVNYVDPTHETASRPVATPFGMVDAFDGSLNMECDISKVPSRAFQSIMRWNPGGQYLRKQKP